ncbi:hypothetical protein K402DRAFT_424948 [Aulographum hederae CBS 113979]|uniref:Cyanobacterial phytochrome B n=1 Tax=Aulographum hederae CBS 113979 TaxID=1176131 RepID=A0A6G1GLY6_9PEZI|nr:hypothetical protein K402DRAFT_424948 [Aulographum hederae CBS 113979]
MGEPSSPKQPTDDPQDNSPTPQANPWYASTPYASRNPPPRGQQPQSHIITSPGGGSGRHTDNEEGLTSPISQDRVFPIRSVVSVDPTPTPGAWSEGSGYFPPGGRDAAGRRQSETSGSEASSSYGAARKPSQASRTSGEHARPSASVPPPPSEPSAALSDTPTPTPRKRPPVPKLPAELFRDLSSSRTESELPKSAGQASSVASEAKSDETPAIVTARFKHVISDEGHAVITGRDGETLQRCEDEPIHIPGAVQAFGLLIALEEDPDGRLVVRIVSENSKRIIGYTPQQLFQLDNFCDILSEEQSENLLDHIDFIRDDEADVETNGPEVFTLSVRPQHGRKSLKLWCALHMNPNNPGLVICEFELEDDPLHPLVPPGESTPELPEDTLQSHPTAEELAESTENTSRPLRVLRSARKRKGEAAAMEVFNIMSQVQEQLASAPSLDKFLKVLVGVVKELTGFHRVMVYQFDQMFNGRVVTELVDPRATKDLYKGLNFPASDIPKQARDLYKINRVRLLYDRDLETARLVCRTVKDLETPLDLTYAYLRAMSPIHLKYLANMAVRSSMSISINAFNELWGLISCHSYGNRGTRVSFPIRKMCRLVGDSASRNIERLSYASRLQARKLINTVPTQHNPSGYIIASSEDLLKLFDADFGLLSIRDETKVLGNLGEASQEGLAMLEYLRMRRMNSVTSSQDIKMDFPDLRYAPGFKVIAGMLVVPLSVKGFDFIVFFRRGQLKEVKWAGNPYEKFIKAGTQGYLEPRKSFKVWSETVIGKCREWKEEEIETAAVLCLVYGKFIEVWRQKEAALQSSELTRLLLANSAHEVRTPLNAIINYLEIALESSLDSETRENLAKSHSASKSLIYVINDLLDLTKTEEGGDLIKGETFDLSATLREATDAFRGDAKRKGIEYEVLEHSGLPQNVIGDQRKVRQAIANITANAVKNTSQGGVKIEVYVVGRTQERVDVEVTVSDTGCGMSNEKVDALFNGLEQVQTETSLMMDDTQSPSSDDLVIKQDKDRPLGLGLAVVARIVRNMNGQLRLKSEEGKGSRFTLQFPFDLPDSEVHDAPDNGSRGSTTPQPSSLSGQGEVTLVDRDSHHGSAASSSRSSGRNSMVRRHSGESANSKFSKISRQSHASGGSNTSDVDRLIEAIQMPHMVDKSPSRQERSHSSKSTRPRLEQRRSYNVSSESTITRMRSRSMEQLALQSAIAQSPEPVAGEQPIHFQGTPLKAVKVPESVGSPIDTRPKPGRILGEDTGSPEKKEEALSAAKMRVLVAEDDPVNSRIIKKRLETIGHEVHLTLNGEECATMYGEKSGFFDVVLMDMQMPIADGLTSTKMIRAFEKSNPDHELSPRASRNRRVPIIAVSASLLERERQLYIDAGFDGWILKPVSFPRLSELMTGIVDSNIRQKNIYSPGNWEKGGWLHIQTAMPARTEPAGDGDTSKDFVSAETKIATSQDETVDPSLLVQRGKEVEAESLPDGSSEKPDDEAPVAKEDKGKGHEES